MCVESRVITRNSNVQVGAYVFPWAIGTFSSVKRHNSLHSEGLGLGLEESAMKKSSKICRTFGTPSFVDKNPIKHIQKHIKDEWCAVETNWEDTIKKINSSSGLLSTTSGSM